jgi:glycosyltransferase involved in cell wall biosynthesis
MVCDVLGEENNGTTIAAMNLIRSLRKKGHTVRILCPDASKKNEKDFYVVDTLNLGPLNGYIKKNGVSLAKGQKKVIEKALDGADLIHIMMPFNLGVTAMKIAKKNKIPITAGFHCQAENFTSHIFMKDNPLANIITYHTFYNNLYKHVDAIHYPTQFIRDTFEKQIGKTNGYVISNGVGSDFIPTEVEKPNNLKGKKVILFTGRYSKEKSHKVLIKAALKSKYSNDIQLVFAGDGPLKSNLQKKGRKLKNPPILKFFSRKDMIDTINSADLYVHPAEIEIEAISCLEAISCGLVPVISDSKRSATRFFALDDKNLFKCNDSTNLAEKIDYWFDNPKEKENRSKEYQGFSKQFDFDECMNKMEQMIIETIKNKNKGLRN